MIFSRSLMVPGNPYSPKSTDRCSDFFTFCLLAKKGKKKGDFLGQVDRRTRIDSRPGDPDGDPDRTGGSARRLAEAEGELRKEIIPVKHLVIL